MNTLIGLAVALIGLTSSARAQTRAELASPRATEPFAADGYAARRSSPARVLIPPAVAAVPRTGL